MGQIAITLKAERNVIFGKRFCLAIRNYAWPHDDRIERFNGADRAPGN
jgi:hypothetical protein